MNTKPLPIRVLKRTKENCRCTDEDEEEEVYKCSWMTPDVCTSAFSNAACCISIQPSLISPGL
jgi:hypothetical protein